MVVFGLFRKGFDADLFEKELTDLTESISSTQNQITKLIARDKAVRKALLQYIIVGYLVLNGYYYMKLPASPVERNWLVGYFLGLTSKQLITIVAYPILGYLVNYVVELLFSLLIKSRKSYLKKLKKKHEVKIDELKSITNYNKTKTLLNKYSDNDNELKQRPPQQSQGHAQGQQQQRQPQPGQNVSQGKLNPTEERVRKELNLGPNTSHSVSNPLNKPPSIAAESRVQEVNHKRTMQERMLDLLIGSDNNESIESRFALICFNCYAHNGLAPPGTTNPLHVKYICYKCGTLNGEVGLEPAVSSEPTDPEADAKEEIETKVDPSEDKESEKVPSKESTTEQEKDAPDH